MSSLLTRHHHRRLTLSASDEDPIVSLRESTTREGSLDAEFDEAVGAFEAEAALTRNLVDAIEAFGDEIEASPLRRRRSMSSLSDLGENSGEADPESTVTSAHDTPKSSPRMIRPMPSKPKNGGPAGPRSPRRVLLLEYEEKPPRSATPTQASNLPPGLDLAQFARDQELPGPESPVSIAIHPGTPRLDTDEIDRRAHSVPPIGVHAFGNTAGIALGEPLAMTRPRSRASSLSSIRDRLLLPDVLDAVRTAEEISGDGSRSPELRVAVRLLEQRQGELSQAIRQHSLPSSPDDGDSSSSGSDEGSSGSEPSFGHSPRSEDGRSAENVRPSVPNPLLLDGESGDLAGGRRQEDVDNTPERGSRPLIDEADKRTDEAHHQDGIDHTPMRGPLSPKEEADDTPDTVASETIITPHMPSRDDSSSRAGRVISYQHAAERHDEEDADDEEAIEIQLGQPEDEEEANNKGYNS